MSKTRPDIIVMPNQQNDIVALLNEQAGFPAVTAGQELKIQNKTNVVVYVHKTAGPVTEIVGGNSIPKHWQATVEQGSEGCIVTCSGKVGRINVEVIS
ncbi:MAG: hypothetical protein CML20_09355 [Rheinheimera sp.]|nr:hypothetical protein [Rheinheimera sp.]